MLLLFVNYPILEIPSTHQYMDGKLFILGVMAHASTQIKLCMILEQTQMMATRFYFKFYYYFSFGDVVF